MIVVKDLRKTFGEVVAVDKVNMNAERGEIFGLLGPNGAGKTTTLRMLYGIFTPTAGSISIDNLDVRHHTLAVQKKIGVLPDGGSLYKRLTARENIRYFGELHGMPSPAITSAIAELTELLSMENIIDRKTAGFSQGERMKVNLARAIIHDPDYILLDEPTNGLDVLTTRAVRKLLLTLKEKNKCVIFSSHLMHEVSHLCDRVGIIAQGRVVAEGDINTIIHNASTTNLEDAFVHFAYEYKDMAKNVNTQELSE
ncbi:ATP-binding cassette domain-containing protein [Agarilytica rhodophyticola]|uniref:ABC transporter ATP-binding protein n=1 Tax=Agarilytica rhodophyticola TaxID=1737490 RepID=UPI000B345578|nr:ATP-binding cassette domain-containing protein [Agarilytica rhodophyticola]